MPGLRFNVGRESYGVGALGARGNNPHGIRHALSNDRGRRATTASMLFTESTALYPESLPLRYWFRSKDHPIGSQDVLFDRSSYENHAMFNATLGIRGVNTAAQTPNGGPALVGTQMSYNPIRDLGLRGNQLLAQASSELSSVWIAEYGVDGGTSNGWASGTNDGWYLVRRNGSASAATSYQITPREAPFTNQSPKDWTFEGSMNASNWTVLDTRNGETSWSSLTERSFSFSNTTPWVYYRLKVTAINGGSPLAFWEFKLDNVTNTTSNRNAELWIVLKSNGGSGPQSWKYGGSFDASHYTYGGNVYEDFGSTVRYSFTPTLSVSSWRVFRVVVSGSVWTAYIDNVQQYTTSSSTKAWDFLQRTLFSFSGAVAEKMVVDGTLGLTESNSLYTYLNNEHGLSVALTPGSTVAYWGILY